MPFRFSGLQTARIPLKATMTKTIDVHTSQISLEEAASLVRKGAEIILTDASIPFARMVPLASPAPARTPGLHAGAIHTGDDFDEPLPDEFWVGRE